MRKIVVILCLTLFLSSCYYIWPVYPEEEEYVDTRQFAQVTSSHLFTYNGRVCIACNAYTIEEVEAYLAEHPDMLLDSAQIEADRLTREARARRDNLLRETVDSVNPMRWEALTELQKDAWRAYRQALLDVPQQEGFPTNIIWPNIPEV